MKKVFYKYFSKLLCNIGIHNFVLKRLQVDFGDFGNRRVKFGKPHILIVKVCKRESKFLISKMRIVKEITNPSKFNLNNIYWER